ncbi:MAG: YolD-like family protein [Anaeroplasmataceae bacterium]|nr:YolD-like family protein [Anaeroplasmataceae bacterium]
MTEKERRAAKYLPFDSLKGFKEAVQLEDQKLQDFHRPVLSEDEKWDMNLVLLECYSKNQAVVISYYEKGVFRNYCGVVKKIDFINKQIILLPKKKFWMEDIYKIIAK